MDTLIRLNLGEIGESKTASELADRVRSLVLADNFKPIDEKGALYFPGSSLIIASDNAVYAVCGAFSVDKWATDSLCALGAGGDFALGAGFAARGRSAPERLRVSLKAAIALNNSCGGEAWITSV